MSLDGHIPTSAPRLTGWPALPMEIRWQIRDYIRTLVSDWPDHHPPLPQLPLVCREWNECRNKERRKVVRYIVLRIRLPEYSCPACDEEEDDITAYTNDSIFMDTIRRFVSIVSNWNRSFFTLDLGVYSPSDGKHGFRDFRLCQDYHYGATSDMYKQHALMLRKSMAADDDKRTCPGWNRLCKGLAPCMAAKKRLLSTIGDPRRPHFSTLCVQENEDYGYPELKAVAEACAVRSLVIRRHYYRQLSPQLLGSLISHFGLDNLHHEAWRHPDVSEAEHFAFEYNVVLNACMSYRGGTSHCSLVWETSPLLEQTDTPESSSKPTGRFTHHLELAGSETSGSAAYFINGNHSGLFSSTGFISAEDVLEDIYELYGPPSLEKIQFLTLTSRVLQRRESPNSRAFIDLIVGIGFLAFGKNARRLQGLVLWDGDETDGVLFRFIQDYEFEGGGHGYESRIKWRSTQHTADDLAPVFAELRRKLGEDEDDEDDEDDEKIVIDHEQMFEGEHLSY
ncbi:F-box domain-containing protein [Plectosphaerella cucumerina]|uniref:F-box domain-containing protein n=1 Tax=Plectosphaerella cucumerina TaxID=40658 RepID=A0A8K0X0W9_9PEZI|nr:F-box domain-containing protein [Plectosphaerella cucumerina]